MKFNWISQHQNEFPTAVMCKVLNVSDSGFYGHQKLKPSAMQQKREAIARAASKSYFESERIYGYRKVHSDLPEKIKCCQETIRRIMQRIGLFSRIKRKFVHTTDSNHTMAIAENLLDRDFGATAVNTKWAADITYIPTEKGWLYFAAVMDLYSRRIIGWSMSDRIDSKLVSDALRMAIQQRRPDAGLIHHSDRGVQYASEDFQEILKANRISCSMSRRGNCWDNACMESFFGSLKTEWIRDKKYMNFEEAKKDIFKYVEVFYNRKRRHASLGYVSPAEYEQINEKERKQVA